jgi:hypothetical protein
MKTHGQQRSLFWCIGEFIDDIRAMYQGVFWCAGDSFNDIHTYASSIKILVLFHYSFSFTFQSFFTIVSWLINKIYRS